MAMIYLNYFKFFCYVSYVAGFRFLRPSNVGKFLNSVWKGYSWFSDFIMALYVFRITCRFFFAVMTTAQILETIPTFFYVTQIFIKSVLIRVKAKQLDVYFFKMKQFMTHRDGDEIFKQIWRKTYTVSNNICKTLFACQVFGLGLSFLPSLYSIVADPDAPVIHFAAFYVFRDYHFGFKVFYLILDLISSIFCVVKICAIEALYLTCVSFHISLYEYLTLLLKQIHKKPTHEMKNWTRNHQEFLRYFKIHFKIFGILES